MFLKLAEELGVEDRLPERCRWSALKNCSDDSLVARYSAILQDLSHADSQVVRHIFSRGHTSIKKAQTLKVLVQGIDRFEWYELSREGLGDLYEGLLEKNANEKRSGAGQYFTPRPLIDSIVRVMKPTLSDTIQDPAAGTAGFLVSAGNHIRSNTEGWNRPMERKLSKVFHGVEHVEDTYNLALMNLFLHGLVDDKSVGLLYGDTLAEAGQLLPPATLVLSNPPFGTKRGGGLPARTDLPFPTSNKQLCFVQHIVRTLAPGGRAAIVVPDNVLYEETVGRNVRRYLMEECSLHTMVRLPPGLFYATSVKTHVIFLTKNDGHNIQGTHETWVYDLRSKVAGRNRADLLSADSLFAFESAFGQDPWVSREALEKRRAEAAPGFVMYDRAYIRRNEDNLLLTTDDPEDADMGVDDLNELVTGLSANLRRSQKALDELHKLLLSGPES